MRRKKRVFFSFVFLVICIFVLVVLFFVPLPSEWGSFFRGPGVKASFHVIEGEVQVFSLRGNRIGSFLGSVGPGQTLVAGANSGAVEPIPFWLSWVEPFLVEGLGRVRYSMSQYGQRQDNAEFTVRYDYERLQAGASKFIEKNPLISAVHFYFSEKGFVVTGKVGGIDASASGTGGIAEGFGDKLFLHLYEAKFGPIQIWSPILRALENLFAVSYARCGKFDIQLIKVQFSETGMSFTFRKEAGSDRGAS